jgi:hypothetical protein
VSTDGRLDGPLELHVKSTYNTTEKVGWISVKARVLGDDGRPDAHGRLHAVNVDGKLEGLLVGHVHDAKGKLLANVSATYSVLERTLAWARGMAALPPVALRKTRLIARERLRAPLDKVDEDALELFMDDWFSAETQGALGALAARLRR